MIAAEGLRKTYRVPVRAGGLGGALRALVRPEYREVTALEDVSFSIEAGELVGYIGPNGAGKSTTVKVLSGILVPDRGDCQVAGRTPWIDRVAHVGDIGVVFGQRTQLWWDLPLEESFELLRHIYRVPSPRYRETRQELVERLDLGPLLDTPVRQLSLGQRMRADLAAALLHEPAVLFLDEPTIGLDAPSKLEVRAFVRERNRERGTTVILTTHDMDDVEALCQRVMVIGRGRLLSDGSLADLRARFGRERRIAVDLERPVEDFEDPEVRVVAREGRRLHLAFDPEACPTPQLLARLASRLPLRDVFVEEAPIEELVAQLYRDLEGEA
jgi:ABC-2 type transport system ATP-binding protein